MKCGGLGILDPGLPVERTYNISKVARKVLVGSLIGGTNLNYVAHKGCIRRASDDGRKQRDLADKAVLSIRKDLADGAGLNRLRKTTENGDWLVSIPHRLNGTNFSWEEFQNNILLQYGIVPLNLSTDCCGCGKIFSVPHASSCPKGGLVIEWHNDATK